MAAQIQEFLFLVHGEILIRLLSTTSGTEICLHKFASLVARLSRLLTNLVVITTLNTILVGFKNEECVDKAGEPGLAHRIVCNPENSDSHSC